MAGSMAYRLPVGDATALHMQLFGQATAESAQIGDNRGYNHIAGFHGAPFWYCWHHQFNPRTPARSQLFLPWHRAYLWWLEQSLLDLVDEAALPWWDWTVVTSVPPGYNARRLPSGDANPLYNTKAYVPTAQ